jgi:hypothetical protein
MFGSGRFADPQLALIVAEAKAAIALVDGYRDGDTDEQWRDSMRMSYSPDERVQDALGACPYILKRLIACLPPAAAATTILPPSPTQAEPASPARAEPIETSCDYASLDPGIRDVVRALNRIGFDTTDSGDGVSKPADERVFGVPHVACRVSAGTLLAEADRLAEWLTRLGTRWRVEASYCPNDQSAILLATEMPLPAQAATEGDSFKEPV